VQIKPNLEFLWQMNLPDYRSASPTVSPRGDIVLPGGWNHIVSYSNGVALASSPWPKFKGNVRNTGNIKDNP
jgi:hypothetical protein